MYKRFKWCISDRRSVSDRLKARGCPRAKGYNSSASQWLSGEQVRLCLGHPKAHFETIAEGSCGRGGGGGEGVSPPGSLTISKAKSGESDWKKLWRACWRQDYHTTPSSRGKAWHLHVEQNGQKTVYTQSGRKANVPHRQDLWKGYNSLTWQLFIMLDRVQLLEFRYSWILNFKDTKAFLCHKF